MIRVRWTYWHTTYTFIRSKAIRAQCTPTEHVDIHLQTVLLPNALHIAQ